ncbi:MAG: hypothetical protein JHD02_00040 [Thermoleophilaceae bacterium]|nr:hypothetical protein [Thermoleophilaceae bacterium]
MSENLRLAESAFATLEERIQILSKETVAGFVHGSRGWRDAMRVTADELAVAKLFGGENGFDLGELARRGYESWERGLASRGDEDLVAALDNGHAREMIGDIAKRVNAQVVPGDMGRKMDALDAISESIPKERFLAERGEVSSLLEGKNPSVLLSTIKETLIRSRLDVEYSGAVQLELLRIKFEQVKTGGSLESVRKQLELPSGGADQFESQWLERHWNDRFDSLAGYIKPARRSFGEEFAPEVLAGEIAAAVPRVAAGEDTWGFRTRAMGLRPEDWSQVEVAGEPARVKVDLASDSYQFESYGAGQALQTDLVVELHIPAGKLPPNIVQSSFDIVDHAAMQLRLDMRSGRFGDRPGWELGSVVPRFGGEGVGRIGQKLARDLQRTAGLESAVGMHRPTNRTDQLSLARADKKFGLLAVTKARQVSTGASVAKGAGI